MEFKEDGQEYAQVVKMLGNGRCECFCFDGVTRLGHIRGKMRKKVWITAGDIILVAKRDFQDEKVDIVHKYTADEARNLKQYGELPENARINETAVDMAMADDNDDDDLGIRYVFFFFLRTMLRCCCFNTRWRGLLQDRAVEVSFTGLGCF